ncbi:hypothetical protein LTR38_018091, partial [Friedmanniomyces endolithicus]
GKNWHMFKSEQVSAEDEEYPIDVLIQQATFFGQFPLSYEDIIDAKQNQTLAAILYYIKEHNSRKPFSVLQNEEVTDTKSLYARS